MTDGGGGGGGYYDRLSLCGFFPKGGYNLVNRKECPTPKCYERT